MTGVDPTFEVSWSSQIWKLGLPAKGTLGKLWNHTFIAELLSVCYLRHARCQMSSLTLIVRKEFDSIFQSTTSSERCIWIHHSERTDTHVIVCECFERIGDSFLKVDILFNCAEYDVARL